MCVSLLTPCSVVQTRANDGNSTVFNETHISPPLRAVKHNLNIPDTSHSTAQARRAYDPITSLHKLQSFCRKQNNNFGGFLPIVIKITNNFTKYVMHQLFSLSNFLIRHGFHIFYCVHIWHLLLVAFTVTNSYIHPRICASECHDLGTMHKKSSKFV